MGIGMGKMEFAANSVVFSALLGGYRLRQFRVRRPHTKADVRAVTPERAIDRSTPRRAIGVRPPRELSERHWPSVGDQAAFHLALNTTNHAQIRRCAALISLQRRLLELLLSFGQGCSSLQISDQAVADVTAARQTKE